MNQSVNWVPSVSQPAPKSSDWLTIAQLVFSTFFTLAYGAASVLLLALSLPELNEVSSTDPSPLLGYSVGILCAILALFNLASTYYSGKKLKLGVESIHTEKRLKWLNGIVILMPILLVVGILIFPYQPLRNYLLPVLTSLIIVLGVIWLIRLGSGNAWGTHPQRDSGLISLMTGFTIWFIMFLEVLVVLLIGTVLLAGMISNPELLQKINTLTAILQTQPDPSQIIQALEDMISMPLLIGLGFLLIAVIVPIIEELFKTLGVWLLASRRLTPQEGWIAGLMSGAAFALVEGLFYSIQIITLPDSTSWAVATIGRMGGSLLHTFCGGLIGWAFAKTWSDRKIWRVVGTFVLVILIHGIWNSLALLPSLSTLGGTSGSDGNLLTLPLIVVMILVFFAYLARSSKLAGQA